MNNYKYKLLDEAMFPRFVQAFRDFYRETEKKDMPVPFMDNWMLLTLSGMKNQASLYLLATLGKKVAGFRILIPCPGYGNEMAVQAGGLYVAPAYRNGGIATKLLEVSKAWAKHRGYTAIYMQQDPDGGKWVKRTHFGYKPFKMILRMEV